MLSMDKFHAGTNASLDVLKLVDAQAAAVLKDITDCFYGSGLNKDTAVMNLKKIQGRMEVLRSIVANSV